MGAGTRHYKALMKKNFINWKRTPCGSLCEILCPLILILILWYARTQADPQQFEDQSFYSLRRPFYPIAKPELGNNFMVNMSDQQRQFQEYKEFFGYMDFWNLNVSTKINATQAIEAVAKTMGTPEIAKAALAVRDDIRMLTNLTRLIEQTPIKDLTANIQWDGIADLLKALGLDNIIDVDQALLNIKAAVQTIEDTLSDPNALIADVTGVDFQAIVNDFVDSQLGIVGLESIDINYLGYMPIFDPFGAYFFYPDHCYPPKKRSRGQTRYNSPIIGYVRTGSSVEEDIVAQLDSLFKTQRQMKNGIAIMDVLGFNMADVDTKMLSNFIREDEIEKLGEQLGKRFNIKNGTDIMKEAQKTMFPDVDQIMSSAKDFGRFKLRAFDSQAELDTYIADERIGSSDEWEAVCFAFAVHENESKNKYELELFYNDLWPGWLHAIPNQKRPVWNSYEYEYKQDEYLDYSQSGFTQLQNWVANTILKRTTGKEDASIVTMVVPSKLPPYVIDDFGQIITGLLSFCLFIMYIPPIFRTTYRIVAEKESKVKESMRMMGLRDTPYWLSWLTYFTIINTMMSLIVWGILWSKVISKTEGWILFAFIWLFGQSLFGLMLVTQSIFVRARAAAIVTSLIYFGSSTGNYFVNAEDTPMVHRIWASLSPTIAMIQTSYVIGKFESSQVGSRTENIWSEFNNFSVGIGLIMMAFNCVWLLLFGLYLEQVMPKTFGRSRHPCYFLKPSFWGCCKGTRAKIGIAQVGQTGNNFDSVDQTLAFETIGMNPQCYEKLTPEFDEKETQQQLLKVSGLHKQYENGFKAVNGLNVKLYQDQIFCLLGHNGAGKTTTISILTGLIQSSQGDANLFGIDMFSSMDEARKTMGVCPQHDVLFDLLTPEEHLDIFYEFKGADKTNKKKEIDQMLIDIGVADKKKNYAYQLSGGNKRKLSVAIALCGNSKFVLLDEPSSGLDIQARRQLWEMLRAQRKNRIILLTTHYMDEADILGDRIGIMTAGKMTALGSSMFLKSRFGMGYVMTIVKSNPAPNDKVLPYLQEKLGNEVHKLSEIQGEMTIQIPREYTILFKDFFSDFDNDIASLDIQTYGVSVTTLEQVFLEIGHDPNPKPKIRMEDAGSRPQSRPGTADLIDKNSEEEGKIGELEVMHRESSLPGINQTVGQKDFGQLDILSDVDLQGQRDSMRDNTISQLNLNKDENGDLQSREPTPMKTKGEQTDKGVNPQDLERAAEPEEQYEKFSLSESKLDKSFCNNFCAVLAKRVNSYKRSKKRVLTEILLPSAFMALGVWMSSLDFAFRSPSRVLTPDLYPLKQKLLMNENLYNEAGSSGLTPTDFASALPDSSDAFDVTYNPKRQGATFDNFGDDLYEFGITEASQEPYMYGSYEIYEANKEEQTYKFVSYVNLTSTASVALFPQFMYESILRVANDDPEFEFKTRSTPYPLTYEIKKRVQTSDAGQIIFFSSIAYSIVITVTISYLVVERVSQLKHVQVITGMRLSSYWIVNFMFDAFKLYVTIATTLLLFHVFDQEYPTATYVLLAFPFGILPFTYVWSYLFSAESAAQTFTFFCQMFIILFASLLVFILRVIPDLELLGDRLHYAFRIFPSYSVASSMYVDSSLTFISAVRNNTDGPGPDISPDPWHWNNNTFDLAAQGVHFFFWFFLLFLIEADLGKRCRKCYNSCCRRTMPKKVEDIKLDSDVIAEQTRVAETANEDFKIKVQDLRKVYQINGGCCNPLKPLVAVENISFGLQAGECFALLGVNGAGKSTTFKTLTSEVEPTEGNIHIGALDIRKDFNNIKKLIGYCPQTNSIFDYMSVEENIWYFARIKGIPKDRRDELCNRVIKQLDLSSSRKKLAGTLSGGNKRKLCVAMAIVGSPPIILLDEPSAGMDPEARRFMWRVVGQIASDKTSAVILTTHSMEEAEALSTKMGIMVKGGIFKCFGTPQHIKDKFGTGFVIEIKAALPMADEIEDVRNGILNPDNIQDPALKEALSRATLSTDEAAKILSAAEVPGIVIDSILHLDQKIDNEDEMDAEDRANELLKRQFTLTELASDVFVKGALFGVIESLCHDFINVEVIEHYGNYMRLRVERHTKSIGFLFKLIEELKEEHQLEDYSVSQTTLEQIFQGFADLKFNENVPTYCVDEESGELAKIVFDEQ